MELPYLQLCLLLLLLQLLLQSLKLLLLVQLLSAWLACVSLQLVSLLFQVTIVEQELLVLLPHHLICL